jgi:hypothetical protein
METASGTHYIGDSVGPRASLNAMDKCPDQEHEIQMKRIFIYS